jgi:hypothetical protein
MKLNKIIIIFIFLFIFLPHPVAAQSVSPSNTSEVNQIKEKIASKVAEISPAAFKIALRGKVTKINSQDKSFDLDVNGNKYTCFYIAQTQFFWIKAGGDKLSLNFSSIETGDDLMVVGEKQMQENQISADKIFGKTFFKFVVGRLEQIAVKTRSAVLKTLNSETKYTADLANVSDEINLATVKNDQLVIGQGVFKDTAKTNLNLKSLLLIIQN